MQKQIEKYLQSEFQTNGVTPFRIDSISKALCVSKKTIYKIYDSKEDLIEKTLMNILLTAYNEVINIIAEESPFVEKFYSIFRIVKSNLRTFDDKSLLTLKKSYPAVWLKIARFRKYDVLPLLNMLIAGGIKKGVLYDYPIEIYLHLIYSIIKETAGKGGEELDLLLQIILNGSLTKKGRKFLNNMLVNVN